MDQLTELYRNKALDLQKKINLLENQLSLMEKRLDDYEAPTAEERKKAEEIATSARASRKAASEESEKLKKEYEEALKKATEDVASERKKITGKYDVEDASVKVDALRKVLFDNPAFADVMPEEQYVSLTGGISKPLVIGKSKTGTLTHQTYEPGEEQKTETGAEYKTIAPAYKAYRENIGRQAAERAKELVTDPQSLKAIGALAAASAVAAPVVAVGGAALGAYSGVEQAKAGRPGAAAVDIALGLIPFAGGKKAFSFTAPGRVRGTFSGEPAPVKPEVSPKPSEGAKWSGPEWPKPEPQKPFAPKIDLDVKVRPRVRVTKGTFGEPKIELVGEPLVSRKPGWAEKRRPEGYVSGRPEGYGKAPPEAAKPTTEPVGMEPPVYAQTTTPKPTAPPSAGKVVAALAAVPGVETAAMAPLPKEIPAVPALVSRMMGWEKGPTITVEPTTAVPTGVGRAAAKPAAAAPKVGGVKAVSAVSPTVDTTVSPEVKPEAAAPTKTPAPAVAPGEEAAKVSAVGKAEEKAPVQAPEEAPVKAVEEIPAKAVEEVPAVVQQQQIAQVTGGPPKTPPEPPPVKPEPKKPQEAPKRKPPPRKPSIPFFASGREGGGAVKTPGGQVARLDLGLAADALGQYAKYYRIA